MIVEVQSEIYSKIDGIVGLGAEVYDHAPQDSAAYPYIVLDPMDTIDNSTITETNAFVGQFNIHVWSDNKSSLETATIQKKIYDALHLASDLAPTPYEVGIIIQESSRILRDPDGITRHGVQTYRIEFEPTITYTY